MPHLHVPSPKDLRLFSQYSPDETHDIKSDHNRVYEQSDHPSLWAKFPPTRDHYDVMQYPEPQYLQLLNGAYPDSELLHLQRQNDVKMLYVLLPRYSGK